MTLSIIIQQMGTTLQPTPLLSGETSGGGGGSFIETESGSAIDTEAGSGIKTET